MESRVKETIVRHDKGYNCAQAVACTYCDLFGYKEEDVFRMTEGFGLGMGCMAGTCGALSGAVLLAGLKTVTDRSMPRRPKEKHISCPDSCWSVFRSAAVLPSVQS